MLVTGFFSGSSLKPISQSPCFLLVIAYCAVSFVSFGAFIVSLRPSLNKNGPSSVLIRRESKLLLRADKTIRLRYQHESFSLRVRNIDKAIESSWLHRHPNEKAPFPRLPKPASGATFTPAKYSKAARHALKIVRST